MLLTYEDSSISLIFELVSFVTIVDVFSRDVTDIGYFAFWFSL